MMKNSLENGIRAEFSQIIEIALEIHERSRFAVERSKNDHSQINAGNKLIFWHSQK